MKIELKMADTFDSMKPLHNIPQYQKSQPILGRGSFGFVYRGTIGDQHFAVKKIWLRHVVYNEVIQHKKLDHQNIVKLLQVERDDEYL